MNAMLNAMRSAQQGQSGETAFENVSTAAIWDRYLRADAKARVRSKLNELFANSDPYKNVCQGKLFSASKAECDEAKGTNTMVLVSTDDAAVVISECAPWPVTVEESEHDVTFRTVKYLCTGVVMCRVFVTSPIGGFETSYLQWYFASKEFMDQMRALIVDEACKA